MKNSFSVKCLGIIFILATLFGSLHHHNDLKGDSDCQICIIQNTMADIDTPVDVNYLALFSTISEAIVPTTQKTLQKKLAFTFTPRAPPSPIKYI